MFLATAKIITDTTLSLVFYLVLAVAALVALSVTGWIISRESDGRFRRIITIMGFSIVGLILGVAVFFGTEAIVASRCVNTSAVCSVNYTGLMPVSSRLE
jgi:hypothetical protein